MLTQSGTPGHVIDLTNFSLKTWISSKFSMFHWICLLFICLFCWVELSLWIVVTPSYNLFSGFRLNIKSFRFIFLFLL